MKLLFVGDVVGSPGRQVLEAVLPGLREQHAPDWLVVNGENSAGGLGVTAKTARAFFDMGADAITLGNHAYRHRDVYPYLDEEPRIVRPANYVKGNPGRGHTVVEKDGARLGRREPVGDGLHEGGAVAVHRDRRDPRGARRPRRPRARRLPRRGDQREGRDGLARRRARDGVRRHAHARADRRRARAARRDRLHLRRRHDGRARQRDRRARASRRSSRSAPRCRSASTRPTRTRGSMRC